MNFLKSKYVKFILSLLLSVAILFLLYRRISFENVVKLIAIINPYYFTGFIALIGIQLVIASFRWKRIMAKLADTEISLYKSSQLVIGSYSANLIIPAKMGEFIRIAWESDKEKRKRILRLVIFEKILDVLSLYLLYTVSLAFVVNSQTRVMLFGVTVLLPFLAFLILLYVVRNARLKKLLPNKITEFFLFLKKLLPEKQKFFRNIVMLSIVLWIIQVGQFILIFLSMGVHPGLMEAYAGNSLAVLAGAFIPSIGGIGPRDATIVWFFEGLASNLLLTTIGLLSALRIIIPALIGLPFFFNLTRKS